LSTSTINELLNWRYATKKMDVSKTVSEEKVAYILEAIRMAPTSSGLQPFEVYVVTDSKIRGEIREVGWDQGPITDGSHLLVFAAWDNYSEERIDAVSRQMLEERGEIPLIHDYYTNLKSMYLPRESEVNYNHASRQAYIALGIAMMAAAELGVDSTPMEGFDPDEVDKILGFGEKGLRSVVILPLGYRDSDGDWLLPMKKVRKALDTLVTRMD
jgi:nitroreductase